MTARLSISFLLLLCVGSCGVASVITGFAIVDAVNAKLPTDEQFNQLGWDFGKTLRLHRTYRRLFPDGRLLRRQGVLTLLALVCLLIVLTLFGFPFLLIGGPGGPAILLIWFFYIRK